jgi:endonuclease/exonuclease/phosphatase family metal-dependent hydrolase
MKHRVVVATYNVHRCIGSDRRHDPARVASVLSEVRADVVGLQEVSTRSGDEGDIDQLASLAEATGMHSMAGPTLVSTRGHCGNALLSRWPIRDARKIDLSITKREPRAAIDADIDVDGHHLRVVVTHLGLRPGERLQQVERLLEALDMANEQPTVILADANEWRPLAALRRRLRHFGYRSLPTFPAVLPILALDLVMVRPAAALRDVTVHRSPLARRASDHLPVKAVLDFAKSDGETHDRGKRRRGRQP